MTREYEGAKRHETTTYAYDGLGSMMAGPQFARADASDDALLSQTYDPYGNLYVRVDADVTSYGFTGEQADSSGLLYLRARYYAPGMGRFFPAGSQPAGDESVSVCSRRGILSTARILPGLCADPDAENYDGILERRGGSTCVYSRNGELYTDLWNSDWYGGCQKCHASNAYYGLTNSAYLYSDELAFYDDTIRSNSFRGLLTCGVAGTASATYAACGLNPIACQLILNLNSG